MVQQGKRSPRIFLVGPGAPPGAGPVAAAVPDVTSIAVTVRDVNPAIRSVTDARPDRYTAGRAGQGSPARHTAGMPPVRPVAAQLRGPARLQWSVTPREIAGDRHPIVGIPVAGPVDSINPQYRVDERARDGGVSLPRNAWGSLGCAARSGVIMSPLTADVTASRPTAGVEPGADAAVARPTTGVDAA